MRFVFEGELGFAEVISRRSSWLLPFIPQGFQPCECNHLKITVTVLNAYGKVIALIKNIFLKLTLLEPGGWLSG